MGKGVAMRRPLVSSPNDPSAREEGTVTNHHGAEEGALSSRLGGERALPQPLVGPGKGHHGWGGMPPLDEGEGPSSS